MSALVGGAASGFVMASVFVCASVFMLFFIVKDPPPGFRAFMERFPPLVLVLVIVILSHPAWGIVGAVAGVLYTVVSEAVPGPGLGSPNLAFTLAVVAVALALGVPLAVLLRRVLAGVATVVAAFVGTFGWFLPHFVA